MKRLLTLLLSLTLVAFLAAGCKSSSTSAAGGSTATSTSASSAGTATPEVVATSCPAQASGFAKTKFLTHAALGFGAFHRYIYKTYKAGTFRSGAHGRLTAFVKAGLAALFIKREIRLAGVAAQNSPALCKAILSPLRAVSETVQDAVNKLKGGDASGINAVQNSVTQAESAASSQGAKITEDQNAPLS
ncbi:MAG TPA: hypothetical protein VGD91_01335 [Trebonia sp.]